MKVRKFVYMSLLTAMALIIFIIEAQIPSLVPMPGVKLGLANIIIVYAVFMLGPKPTFMILICRVFMSSIFVGHMMTLFYSLGGGILCFFSMLAMRKLVTINQIWVCSVVGAIFHNIGQIIVAILITHTLGLVAYLPILLVSGIIAGFFTGICAQFVVLHLPERFKKI